MSTGSMSLYIGINTGLNIPSFAKSRKQGGIHLSTILKLFLHVCEPPEIQVGET